MKIIEISIKLNLIPSNHPFLILLLPKTNPPIKNEMIIEMVNNILKVLGDRKPIYSRKVKSNIERKKIGKLNANAIPIFFK